MQREKTVFIVDDDLAILRSLKRLLNVYGYVAEVFDSAEAFCATANPQNGLCLVLDINLNGTNGIDLRRQLTRSGSSLPVIFVTANDSDSVRRAAIESGCVAYLRKPFSAGSLVDAIGKATVTPQQRLAS